MGSKKTEDGNRQMRRAHNRDLIRRMKNGEPLTRFDSRSSWFPPRPIIEKDKEAINKLYGSSSDVSSKPVKKQSRKKRTTGALSIIT